MDVGEEVVVGEVVGGDRIVRDEAVSSCTERSLKPYHPSPVHDSKGAVSGAYCPDLRCMLQDGMGKNVVAT